MTPPLTILLPPIIFERPGAKVGTWQARWWIRCRWCVRSNQCPYERSKATLDMLHRLAEEVLSHHPPTAGERNRIPQMAEPCILYKPCTGGQG